MSLNILVLTANNSIDQGPPLWLSELDGISIIERIINSTLNLNNRHFIFSGHKYELDKFHLDNIFKLLADSPTIKSLHGQTCGSASTVLFSACDLDPGSELLIISANELVDIDLSGPITKFRGEGASAGSIIFNSIQPNYSYVRLDDQECVSEAAQRNPISNFATTGVFWFARAEECISNLKAMFLKGSSVDGKFYIAPVFNEYILQHKKVSIFKIERSKYVPLKTSKQLDNFERGEL